MHRVIALFAAALAVPAFSAPMTVVIDAGHGGRDRGTNRGGVYESDITLSVAQSLHTILKADKNFRPVLSRADSHGVSLTDRAQMAKRHKADLLVSIHVNSSPDVKARGAEFYFQNQLAPDEESMFLAHKENEGESEGDAPTYDFLDKHKYPAEVAAITADLLNSERIWRSSNVAKALKVSWRGSHKKFNANSIRQAPFYVLSQMTVPSSLVEIGFLTNADDFRDLTDSAKLRAMAEDLYRGIKAYKDSLDKGSPTP